MLQANEKAKRCLQEQLAEDLAEERPIKDIISDVKDTAAKNMIPENEVITLVCLSPLLSFPSAVILFLVDPSIEASFFFFACSLLSIHSDTG